MTKTKNTRTTTNGTRKKRIYTKKHFQSNDGMLTSVWGPSAWHYLHTISFNYPVKPSCEDKHNYRNHIMNLRNTLPCGKCRVNLCANLKKHPLKMRHLKNRKTFSKYVYDLHEIINKMLGKTSGISYKDVRERYEHFRSRCTISKTAKQTPSMIESEKGCTEPIYGEKSKCVIQIVPQTKKCDTFQIDDKCKKSRD